MDTMATVMVALVAVLLATCNAQPAAGRPVSASGWDGMFAGGPRILAGTLSQHCVPRNHS